MNKKKLIISVLCMASLFAMPVQAAVNACSHSQTVPADGYYIWYKTNSDYHQACSKTVTKLCTICGEDLGYYTYQPWETHVWELSNPEYGLAGQVFYDGVCTICGYKDTVIRYN